MATLCTFCGGTIEIGTGMMFVKNDGKVFRFCSSKCRKNQLHLQRKPIHVKWTKLYKAEREHAKKLTHEKTSD
ncbi:MAG: 50S ribosomal protein L24e [Nanoarchaeota archaeon]